MQENSLVVMVEPLDGETIALYTHYNVVRYPVPSDEILTIREMRDMKDYMDNPPFETGVTLEEYPELIETKYGTFWLDAELFREVLPPEVNVEKLLKSERKNKEVLVPA